MGNAFHLFLPLFLTAWKSLPVEKRGHWFKCNLFFSLLGLLGLLSQAFGACDIAISLSSISLISSFCNVVPRDVVENGKAHGDVVKLFKYFVNLRIIDLVYLVYLVYLACLVCLVCFVDLFDSVLSLLFASKLPGCINHFIRKPVSLISNFTQKGTYLLNNTFFFCQQQNPNQSSGGYVQFSSHQSSSTIVKQQEDIP